MTEDYIMTDSLLAMRRQKDAFFKQHPQSPLTPEQQAKFTGLNYYDYNPDLDLVVDIERFSEPQTIQMQTNTGSVKYFQRYGQFTFSVDGQEVRLTLYQADYGFFLPFVDAGAGTETYPAGRYLEPEHLGANRFAVDLNQAYNPYCAYSDGWVCPITPPENRIDAHIQAGEKLPQGDWVISK
jgi:hypothetical protein